MQDLDTGTSPYATPGSIGPKSATTPAASSLGSSSSKDNKEKIQTLQEVDKNKSPEEDDDPRPQPEYDMVFRQAVSAEDVFLGMGNKNPTTASCEELVVRGACDSCLLTLGFFTHAHVVMILLC